MKTSSRIGRLLLVAVQATACCLPEAYAQAPPAVAGYQAYPLRHMRADDAKPQIERLLAGGGEPFEIIVDAASNRLLVGGSAAMQNVASQAVSMLDRPPAPLHPAQPQPAAAPAVPTPVIRSYSLPQVSATDLAADLQQRFGGTGARIAADARTAQVVVAAPEQVQQYIAGRVAELAAAAPTMPNAAFYAPAPGGQVAPPPNLETPSPNVMPVSSQARRVGLQTIPWPELEARLQNLYGGRLSTTAQADGRSHLRLALVDAAPLDLVFDPQTQQIDVAGNDRAAEAALRLIAALDRGVGGPAQRVVPYRSGDQASLRQAMAVSHRMSTTDSQPDATRGLPPTIPLMSQVFQPRGAQLGVPNAGGPFIPAHPGEALAQAQVPPAQGPAPPAAAQPPVVNAQPNAAQPNAAQQIVVPPAGVAPDLAAAQAAAALAGQAGLVGPVQIEFLEGLDVLVISGNDRDVERVVKLIEDIERLSVDTQPTVEIVPLQHVSGDALTTVITQIYDSVLSARQGRVSITALAKPNALLLIGRQESVQAIKDLIAKLDQPVDPATQFAVFPLKHASAAAVQTTLQNFFMDRTTTGAGQATFTDRPALGGKIQITADIRSNAIIVRGGARDLAEAGELIRNLDVVSGAAENELRVFHLENSLAAELAPVLQEAIAVQIGAQQQQQQPGIAQAVQALGQQGGAAPQGGNNAASQNSRSASLRFTTIDAQGRRQYTSGILTEVRITADARANSLLVSAPAEAIELIEALVRQLDSTPAAGAQIKVFTIVNGDATALVEMLNALFGRSTTTGGGGFGGLQALANAAQTQDLIVQLRFSVDQRTNSIIASGSSDDLTIVEAILLRLDDSDIRQRQSIVYRLKNAPAIDVANAINEFLRSERAVQQTTPGLVSPFEQIEREVVVVPEPVSNSLIVSSTPRYFEEIRKLVEDIDKQPPMVLIQVLIAEVSLNNVDEFGIELGLQDSILFDRSLLGDLVTITQSTQTPQGNTVVTTNNQNIVAASNTPGFAFNNAPLGNSGATNALNKAQVIGGQGLSSFAVGRTNADLGFGGLVLSASSESVSVLMRALQESRRLDVLSRPQIMTLDNQSAFIQVGSRVPRVQGVTINETGQVNNVVDVNVGLILGVTPRISPDGLVVMEIDAEKSAVGPESEGVPISVSTTGEVVRQPLINTTTAQTTISAMSGQTVVLGGLITKSKAVVHRRVPVLSSIPVLGNLFRYDNVTGERTELLIIMTPHVVRSDADKARLRQIESARMSWVLGDVKALTGTWGLQGREDFWADEETTVIFPDESPTGEPVPMPPDVAPPQDGAASGVVPGDETPILAPPPAPNASRLPPADEETTLRIRDEQARIEAWNARPQNIGGGPMFAAPPMQQNIPPTPQQIVPVQYTTSAGAQ